MARSANSARMRALTTDSTRRNRSANRRSGRLATISARRNTCGITDRAAHERRAIAFLLRPDSVRDVLDGRTLESPTDAHRVRDVERLRRTERQARVAV